MAVVWGTYDNNLAYNATPTLGLLNGEPLLYCVSSGAADCYRLDGRRRWSVSIPGSSGYAPSLSADGHRLYSTGSNGSLVCLDAETGQRIWSLAESTYLTARCTPALGPDNCIYVVVGVFWRRELRRIRDCGDSAVVEWRLTIGYDHGPVDYGPVVGRNGVVYAIGYGGSRSSLFAVDSSGSVLWKDSARIQTGGFPVIDSRDRVLVTDRSGFLYCFNPDGTLAWSVPTGVGVCAGSTAIGYNGEVIVTDWDGCIADYDSDGQLRWKSASCTYGDNTPCVAKDSTIIAFDVEDDRVCAISYSGQKLWEFSIWDSLGIDKRGSSCLEGNGCNSALIGPNGDLYLATSSGLVCLAHGGLSMANTAWPTYNHDNAHSGWAGRQQR
jgi:outer membrane protein assembly factor BamB